MKNDQYMSLYNYRGSASKQTGLGKEVYAAAKAKGVYVKYEDLPSTLQSTEYARVATYPVSFLDEYFGKETPPSLVVTSTPASDLVYLLGRLETLEKQFAELINKLEPNTTIEDDDDLPF